jgi:hypothetical protein
MDRARACLLSQRGEEERVAAALDVAREDGRREREIEITTILRAQADALGDHPMFVSAVAALRMAAREITSVETTK